MSGGVEAGRVVSPPELSFEVTSAAPVEHAAVPMLSFVLDVGSEGAAVRGLTLTTQIRIAAGRRAYDPGSQALLTDLFGRPEQWNDSLRSLVWTTVTLQVGAFTGRTRAELCVPCTYDVDVKVTKYFLGVRDGVVPLEFLFSGSVFWEGDGGRLATSRISWDHEAGYDLPVRVWRAMMERHYPGHVWLRLDREVFARLYAFKAKHAFPTWESAFEAMLAGEAPPPSPHPRTGRATEDRAEGPWTP